MTATRRTARLVIRPWHVLAGVAALALGLGGLLLLTRSAPTERGPGSDGDTLAGTPRPATAGARTDGPMPRQQVTLYWPSADGSGLRGRPIDVFATESATDQAKQVLGELLTGEPPEGCVAPLPSGVRLRAVFVDERGTAHVSFSRELVEHAPGGSAWELTAVHAVVNSLTASLKQVQRVQILVEGQEVESLTGHLSLSAPLAFSARLVTP